MRTLAQPTLTIGLAAALLVGCGGSQSPVGAPDAIPRSNSIPASSSYQVLYSFNGLGSWPSASLISVNGTLYGTTRLGGYDGYCGTVFSITTTGMLSFLYNFGLPPDAANPEASLVNVNGTLYGTTVSGGRFGHNGKKAGYGTVFSIGMTGTEHVLHSFRGHPDGNHPFASLIDMGGTLYGTTRDGGTNKDGTVFSMSTTGKEHVLYSFGGGPSDGAEPYASLIDVSGMLYGTTSGGGTYGHGTVFSISTAGVEHVLYSFGGSASDGSEPRASLIDVNGTLYGTTEYGGAYRGGYGTVFSISTSGTENVLHSFSNGSDGASPVARLINVKGTLYGTTSAGGGGCSNGCGTVFSVTTGGTERVLYAFKFSDGEWPFAGLIDVNGTLYGTTLQGGEYGGGTVFALTP